MVSCEHGNEPSVLKRKEFLDQLGDYQLFEDPCTIEVVTWDKFHG
jgi:hypothetical protein